MGEQRIKRLGITGPGMMRLVIAAMLMVSLVGVPAVAVGAAPAQQDPGGDYPPEGPPVEYEESIESACGSMPPGGNGELRFRGATPSATYDGVVSYSRTITLAPSAATGDGSLVFADIDVPSDFEAPGEHSVELYRDDTLVHSSSFRVNRNGTLVGRGCGSPDEGSDDGDDEEDEDEEEEEEDESGVLGVGSESGGDTDGSGGDGSGGVLDSQSDAGAAAGDRGGPLPFTGADVWQLVRLAALLIAVGLAVLYWRRRVMAATPAG